MRDETKERLINVAHKYEYTNNRANDDEPHIPGQASRARLLRLHPLLFHAPPSSRPSNRGYEAAVRWGLSAPARFVRSDTR